VNRFGVRGRTFGGDRAEYRVLAIGGSTTECASLDDSLAWTHLVETGLDTTADGRRVWVGNVGRGGMTSRDHVLHVKYLLAQYPRIDLVVSLVGVNDVAGALRQAGDYQLPAPVTERSGEDAQLHHAFVIAPGTVALPWYQTTGLWWLARRAKHAWRRYRAAPVIDLVASRLEPPRRSRRTIGASIDSLPSLEQPLLEYRRNLNAMVTLAAAAGAQVVFVTQPSAWREHMTDAEQSRLWFGWVGGPDWWLARAYYTAGALSRAQAAYNQTLLDVCRERGLTCVDAARLLPRDSTVFFDDMHFTERGSRLLAQALIAALRDRPPFRAGPRTK
jgi:lysophospholipase L1-like esterase